MKEYLKIGIGTGLMVGAALIVVTGAMIISDKMFKAAEKKCSVKPVFKVVTPEEDDEVLDDDIFEEEDK